MLANKKTEKNENIANGVIAARHKMERCGI